MESRRYNDPNPGAVTQWDAALDRLHSLISDQNKAFSDALDKHGARVDAQFASQASQLNLLSIGMATTQQKLADNSERIFGGPTTPGIIGFFKEENTARKNEIEKVLEEHEMLYKKITDVETIRLKDKAWVAGFAVGAGLILKAILSKIGIHF